MLAALFGSTADAEIEGYSGESRQWKIDDDVAAKLHHTDVLGESGGFFDVIIKTFTRCLLTFSKSTVQLRTLKSCFPYRDPAGPGHSSHG